MASSEYALRMHTDENGPVVVFMKNNNAIAAIYLANSYTEEINTEALTKISKTYLGRQMADRDRVPQEYLSFFLPGTERENEEKKIWDPSLLVHHEGLVFSPYDLSTKDWSVFYSYVSMTDGEYYDEDIDIYNCKECSRGCFSQKGFIIKEWSETPSYSEICSVANKFYEGFQTFLDYVNDDDQ